MPAAGEGRCISDGANARPRLLQQQHRKVYCDIPTLARCTAPASRSLPDSWIWKFRGVTPPESAIDVWLIVPSAWSIANVAIESWPWKFLTQRKANTSDRSCQTDPQPGLGGGKQLSCGLTRLDA